MTAPDSTACSISPTVENVGSAAASNLLITDQIPNASSYVADSMTWRPKCGASQPPRVATRSSGMS